MPTPWLDQGELSSTTSCFAVPVAVLEDPLPTGDVRLLSLTAILKMLPVSDPVGHFYQPSQDARWQLFTRLGLGDQDVLRNTRSMRARQNRAGLPEVDEPGGEA